MAMPTSVETLRAPLPSRVLVEAPARLHLGFFDLNGSLGRRFGSLGVALDGLSTRVAVSQGAERPQTCRVRVRPPEGDEKTWGGPAFSHEIQARGPQAERATVFARRTLEHLGLKSGVRLQVEQALAEHVGLGSGTQLALAVGSAVARLHGLRPTAHEIAIALHRGQRSGIGIGAFEQGGFLVDGGHDGSATSAPRVLSRLEIPTGWRWILVFDDRHRGLSGAAEKQAFKDLPPFPEAEAARLCRLMLMQLLPALAEGDIERFGQALTSVQDRVGDYFAPAQGGRYASPSVASALDHLHRAGAAAVGQTSWGPTGFALARDIAQARALVAAAAGAPGAGELRFQIHSARNRGADVVTHSPSPGIPTDARRYRSVDAATPA